MVRVSRPPKPRLSRERVVGKAIELLDAEGPDALTIRRLAAELDTGVGTVYWHVEGKEALLELALDEVLGQTRPEWRATTWDARVREAGLAFYDLMLEHPWAPAQFQASADRGMNAMRQWERLAAVLDAAGFAPAEILHGLSAVTTLVIGLAQQNAYWHYEGHGPESREQVLRESGAFLSALDPAEFPTLNRLAPAFAAHEEREQLEMGLDLLIEGLRVRLARGRG